MSDVGAVSWVEAAPGAWAEVVGLAGRCLAADGGLPLAADPDFVRSRWGADGVRVLHGRGGSGRLVAAGAVRAGADGPIFVGLVDPGARGTGLGGHVLDWGIRTARRAGGRVTVETESVTAGARELFAGRGLRRVFAEDVLRCDLAQAVPGRDWPVGVAVEGWSAANAGRFFAVYAASFRERPGFPGWSAEEWISDLVEDDEFRPGWSVLATLPGVGDAGFVTAAVGWIVQVGVVPAARGRGLGAALVCAALRRMRADGATVAWLDVNVDNPAGALYRRLGFAECGQRARFQLVDQTADPEGGTAAPEAADTPR